jgi:hypothetical protein
MEFRLPANLQTELLSYDPTLKKLASNSKTSGVTKKKAKYPLGNPNDIIPADVLRLHELQNAIDNINSSEVEQRFHRFIRITGDAVPMSTEVFAILYHYESCWYAAWLPPKGKESDYLYGFAFAFKDTNASWRAIPYKVRELRQEFAELKHYGRSAFHFMQKHVTTEDIQDGNKWTFHGWSLPATSWGKGRHIRDCINEFRKAFEKTIPCWEDERDIFERIKCNSLASVLFDRYSGTEPSLDFWGTCPREDWVLSAESFLKLVDYHFAFSKGDRYASIGRIRHIIDKPFFRKWIQRKCDTVNQQYNNPENKRKKDICQGWKQILKLCNRISYINNIWPDCPIDYYQTYADDLLAIEMHQSPSQDTLHWLQKHMPVSSFFNIVSRFLAECDPNGHGFYDHDLGLRVYRFFDWHDTLAMLNTIHAAEKTIQPPRRWRLSEFHDHVQAEAWKIQNPNFALPQDLFPEPVRITHEGNKITFIQPLDTHQLAQWGRAARNCVGSAKHYADGVKKKKHFIVLCMVNNQPCYTVQLEVNNGLMSVKQIAGVCNSRLEDDERDLYTKAFAQALKVRDSELQSA